MKDMSTIRKKFKGMGYKIKTEKITDTLKGISLYKGNEFIFGSGGNVYVKEELDKHKVAISYAKHIKNKYATHNGYFVIDGQKYTGW